MEVRVQSAVEEVEERLKQLQKAGQSPAITPGEGPATNTLQLSVTINRQVTLLY